MYQSPCPACGAPVSWRSAASVMAVCSYCHSTLLREADAVRDIGKMSAVIEDYSPLQIGSSGQHAGLAFSVVGRIQLRYEHGFWNEWYLLFVDGSVAWLADSCGQYTLTREVTPLAQAPLFEKIAPGGRLRYGGQNYYAADVRSAQCIGGEGELPFQVGRGWTARVADLRCGTHFLTLDYSQGASPVVYAGSAVALAELKCQLLRSAEQIATTAGRLPGGIATLACPACGSAIGYRAGSAPHLVCAACQAEVASEGNTAEVLAKHDALAQQRPPLELGAVATIEGQPWTLIGALQRRELGDEPDPPWWEFLLHHPQKGFLWLVKSQQGWQRCEVLDEWPQLAERSAQLKGRNYQQLYNYRAEVSWAAGAFNWRVHVGERCDITEFAAGDETLSAERSEHELVWSRSLSVTAATVAAWFGQPAAKDAAAPLAALAGAGLARTPSAWRLKKLALYASGLMLLLNLPALLRDFDAALLPLIIGFILLWYPAIRFDEDAGGEDGGSA